MKVIDEDGAQLRWTAVYWQHMSKFEELCDSFADAYRLLMDGEEYGNLSSVAILGPDGRVLMDTDALFEADVKKLDPNDLLRKIQSPEGIGA